MMMPDAACPVCGANWSKGEFHIGLDGEISFDGSTMTPTCPCGEMASKALEAYCNSDVDEKRARQIAFDLKLTDWGSERLIQVACKAILQAAAEQRAADELRFAGLVEAAKTRAKDLVNWRERELGGLGRVTCLSYILGECPEFRAEDNVLMWREFIGHLIDAAHRAEEAE